MQVVERVQHTQAAGTDRAMSRACHHLRRVAPKAHAEPAAPTALPKQSPKAQADAPTPSPLPSPHPPRRIHKIATASSVAWAIFPMPRAKRGRGCQCAQQRGRHGMHSQARWGLLYAHAAAAHQAEPHPPHPSIPPGLATPSAWHAAHACAWGSTALSLGGTCTHTGWQQHTRERPGPQRRAPGCIL